MKSLYESILDIDDNINRSINHPALSEFKVLQEYISNKKNWKKVKNYEYDSSENPNKYLCIPIHSCENFCRVYLNTNKFSRIEFEIGQKTSNLEWEICIRISTWNHMTTKRIIKKISMGKRNQTFEYFFKKYLISKFDDIDIFINWLNEE